MRKLIKFLLITLAIILTILFLVFAGGWFYLTSKIASELNIYADQPIRLDEKDDVFLSFKQIRPTGFPFKIAWQLKELRQEERNVTYEHIDPVSFGYDLLKQELFVDLSGKKEIIPKFKIVPPISGVSEQFLFVASLPISRKLLNFLTNIQESTEAIELINYFNELKFVGKNTTIYNNLTGDIIGKSYRDQHSISFTPSIYYKTKEDFFRVLPKRIIIHSQLDFDLKPIPYLIDQTNSEEIPIIYRVLNLFSSNFSENLHIDFKHRQTEDNIQAISTLDIEGNINSAYFNLKEFKSQLSSSRAITNFDHTIKTNAKLNLKSGLFDYLFAAYSQSLAPYLQNSPFAYIGHQINHLLKDKDKLGFEQLEGNDYECKFSASLSQNQAENNLKINELSLYSDNSGLQFSGSADRNLDRRQSSGTLLLHNYPAIIDFNANYIYRFGKFNILGAEARAIYTEASKSFLKEISDYPKSSSNELSFTYSLDSKNSTQNKIGNVNIAQLSKLYNLNLYQKLLDKVGTEGNIVKKMQEIIPSIDPNEPLLKNILASRKGRNLAKPSK